MRKTASVLGSSLLFRVKASRGFAYLLEQIKELKAGIELLGMLDGRRRWQPRCIWVL
ncbi:hypothetical protein J7L00_01880 [Candidatus Bathyarchaeota archaeon]|nr:hypothetical protein [Candidatus Bathyarchaeota archaeon]